jgi:MFS family permease
VFIVLEKQIKNPVLDVGLFTGNATFGFSSLAALLHYSATFSVAFLTSVYLQSVRGMSPQAAGLVLVAQPVMMALFSPLAGRLSDRIEPRAIASAGMGLVVIGLILLSLVDVRSSTATIVASLLVLGLGYALFSSPNMNAIMTSVHRAYFGVASATVGAMRLIGQMLSMAVAMLILSVRVGNIPMERADPAALVDGIRLAFLIAAALCVLGVFASLARGKLRPAATAS